MRIWWGYGRGDSMTAAEAIRTLQQFSTLDDYQVEEIVGLIERQGKMLETHARLTQRALETAARQERMINKAIKHLTGITRSDGPYNFNGPLFVNGKPATWRSWLEKEAEKCSANNAANSVPSNSF